MKVVGIIAEYDPFHNGHLYQIEYAKNELKADAVVVVMSGDFTQRGEPALLDKYTRSKMAVYGGADLVIMMPVAYSTSSAEYFAGSGLGLLSSCGIVTDLLFGAESDDIERLSHAADILSDESVEFKARLNAGLKKGLSFSKARADALPTELSELISHPNNILAIEYLKAIKKLDLGITPHALKREGADYSGQVINDQYASASYIREQLKSGQTDLIKQIDRYLPGKSYDILAEAAVNNELVYPDNCTRWFKYKTNYDFYKGNKFEEYADISKDLAKRMDRSRPGNCSSINQYIDSLKCKNYTRASISRAICHYLLNITPADRYDPAPYLRILDFSKHGRSLMQEISTLADIPMFCNVNDGLKMLSDKPELLNMLKKDIYAADIYSMYLFEKNGRTYPKEQERHFSPTDI